MLETAPRLQRFQSTRNYSRQICETLETEDYVLQAMPDVSPAKWHLAHTTWFFETFVLAKFAPDYRIFNEHFAYLFNSYYETVGSMHPRPERGLLSRPTVAMVEDYRAYVDAALTPLLAAQQLPSEACDLVDIGLEHEKQHQELMLMDLKYNFSQQPMPVNYSGRPLPAIAPGKTPKMHWNHFAGGSTSIGDNTLKSFDNERPQHDYLLQPFIMADRLVSEEEYLEFMNDGGYQNPKWWMAEGWALLQANQQKAPLYWRHKEGEWRVFSLFGERPLIPQAPVTHVSYFEADAYASWRGYRLPLEQEWEHVATQVNHRAAGFAEANCLEPQFADTAKAGGDLHGVAWQWTGSPYRPYPGYRAYEGALAEYNGKFMCNQMVLRGGCVATPRDHYRPTYRNFYGPHCQWPFTGIRLARDE